MVLEDVLEPINEHGMIIKRCEIVWMNTAERNPITAWMNSTRHSTHLSRNLCWRRL